VACFGSSHAVLSRQNRVHFNSAARIIFFNPVEMLLIDNRGCKEFASFSCACTQLIIFLLIEIKLNILRRVQTCN
jgi:hypothetical protein